MGFWKNLCTCVGCVAGLACIALTGGAATPLVTAAAIGIGGVAGHLTGHKIEQEEKKVKNKEQVITNQTKIVENLSKENKETRSELEEAKEDLKKKQEQKQKDNKELEEARNKANDPTLSEEDRKYWRNRIVELEEKLSKDDKEEKNIIKRIKELQDKISNNNKTISNISSGSSSQGKKDIWEFITLENILIVFAIYTLWQIVRDNNRRY